ncbi:MAG: RNA polymerase sporulation sigma factor SigH [Clostridia bacterium]
MSKSNVYYSSDINYSDIQDEDLIEIIRSGDKYALEHLIDRYKSLVNMKVSKYYIIGAEKEDIVQEGLIGLFKAIKSYKNDKQNSFKTFANMCIERQLITAIKSSNRQKHMPLNSYLSLNMNAYDNAEEGNKSNSDLLEVLNANLIEDPLDTITQKEYYEIIEKTIHSSLSEFEKKVLNYYIQGESYVQIATKLDTPVKSIDNAIQRIRKKAIKEIPNEQY